MPTTHTATVRLVPAEERNVLPVRRDDGVRVLERAAAQVEAAPARVDAVHLAADGRRPVRGEDDLARHRRAHLGRVTLLRGAASRGDERGDDPEPSEPPHLLRG